MPEPFNTPLQLDDRTGSGDLAPLLRSRAIPIELTRLSYGDAALLSFGPGGLPVTSGIEIKKLLDVLQCITDGRFSGHQLPGLVESYQYCYLLIEGIWRPDPATGVLQIFSRGQWHDATIGNRRFMYRELYQWLHTIELKTGVKVARTSDRTETSYWLAALWGWWNGKSWDDHKGHLALHTPDVPDRTLLIRPGLVRRMAKELPGVGWDKSAHVARYFASAVELVMAEEDQWREIEGIGKVLAAKIVGALRGGPER